MDVVLHFIASLTQPIPFMYFEGLLVCSDYSEGYQPSQVGFLRFYVFAPQALQSIVPLMSILKCFPSVVENGVDIRIVPPFRNRPERARIFPHERFYLRFL